MFELRPYQEEAVEKIVSGFRELLRTRHTQTQLVFKSPTGSGKTVMAAKVLEQLQDEDLPAKYVYLWAAPQKLHDQSRKKVLKLLEHSRYNLLGLNDLTADELQADSVLFLNWESVTKQTRSTGQWANRAVRQGETERNIIDVLDKTRDNGLEIILIVDEAHQTYMGSRSQQLVNEVIWPKLVFEISATPKLNPTGEDVTDNKARMVKVDFEDVVKSELIKQDTRINEGLGEFLNLETSQLEEVITASLAKRKELLTKFQEAGSDVNPLVLVQISNDDSDNDNFDTSVKQRVEELLAKQGITYENGKLAVWLSGEKQNLDGIEINTNEVQVLIFKQAIALGWDCPRASVLAMLREIGSATFKIQTVGRILRMPELKHYEDNELNSAYVYTNLVNIVVDNEEVDAKAFFKMNGATLKDGIKTPELPSIYLHRTDFHALAKDFVPILHKHLDAEFSLQQGDVTADVRYQKLSERLELKPENLQNEILTNITVRNLDDIDHESIGRIAKHMQSKYDISTIERLFWYQVKSWVLPYSVARSHSRLMHAIYKWFTSCNIGLSGKDEIHRIVVCSENNLSKISAAVNSAKAKYDEIRWDDINAKREMEVSKWQLPIRDEFGEVYELLEVEKYVHDKCYVRIHRSNAEKRFEKMCENNPQVKWWYKNGESMKQYFAVEYVDYDEDGRKIRRTFYPDFIVQFAGGKIGIYDTKSGLTSTRGSTETQRKSNALQMYIALYNRNDNHTLQLARQLMGGILNETHDSFALVTGMHDVENDKVSPWFAMQLDPLGMSSATPVETIWNRLGLENVQHRDIRSDEVWM